MRIVNLQAIFIVIFSVCFAIYVGTSKRQDRFFAEAQGGRRMQLAGLDLPNMGRIALTNWVEHATTQIMTFGFNDIDERFAVSRLNFTEQGWLSFAKAMTQSGLMDEVVKSQQLITAVPVGSATLVWEGLVKGKYNWSFEMKMLITFRSGGVKRVNLKDVRVVLEPVSTRDNPNGVGIGEWHIY